MSPNDSISPISQTDLGRSSDIGSSAAVERSVRALADKEVIGLAPVEKTEPKATKQAESQAPKANAWNIRLQFEVDASTQRVTVLMIDRQSQKVIRTIPADELEKFQEGDLLELRI